ncbi:hypothetical protein ASPZODRAFT_130186 [Penicilliopsis zonata CBS 506.65]|uniref:DUF1772 domain-containing protein n=1 Tax=Penicilliopsis zonata CBS 506.65 TaxID=1073090 RepID=A0A1L9SM11_9EURO|nr:hypothetical protein ASPZODRAFT_130186 [Penicilliopsis zonata CBS 506.65]OJJ48228.1 hypothetical protein ASPZODRAFT_130186 [Penicilliopsis zonata CBS 506.65]
MACPITVSKFVGTVSLGLLTGLSYSNAAITIPSLQLLPTAAHASRALSDVQRLTRKHVVRLTNITTGCLLFSYTISPKHRKHPYLVWMVAVAAVGSYGVDYWFHRQLGVKGWALSLFRDSGRFFLSSKGKQPVAKKEDDLVVVEAEESANGESVQRAMDRERRQQRIRVWLSGTAFVMGIVGLWGDKS